MSQNIHIRSLRNAGFSIKRRIQPTRSTGFNYAALGHPSAPYLARDNAALEWIEIVQEQNVRMSQKRVLIQIIWVFVSPENAEFLINPSPIILFNSIRSKKDVRQKGLPACAQGKERNKVLAICTPRGVKLHGVRKKVSWDSWQLCQHQLGR